MKSQNVIAVGVFALLGLIATGIPVSLAAPVQQYDAIVNPFTGVALQPASDGSLPIGGSVAGGVADSGNPTKVGCVYNTTAPTYVNGNRTDCQSDSRGNIHNAIYGADGITGAGVAAANGDGLATGTAGLAVRALLYGYNGTTWDRVSTQSPYQLNQTPVAASSGNVANASAAATLAGVAAKTTYISGWHCASGGATASADVDITIASVIGGTLHIAFDSGTITGSGNKDGEIFTPPIPASAVNTAITVTMPALGAGNTNATCNAYGYQQ